MSCSSFKRLAWIRATRISALALASSFFLSSAALSKHVNFELPAYDKLTDGAGPETNDTREKPRHRPGSQSLSPLRLSDESESYSVGKDGKMKAAVSENVKAGVGAEALTAGVSESLVGDKSGKLGNKVLKDAKKVSVMPLALVESEDEAQKKTDTISDAEREQLTDLWNATINRSPDIQFVINRLQPNSNPNHATATAMKMLSGILFNAMQAVPFMLGPGVNPAMFMGTGVGSSALASLVQGQEAKNAKKQAISQEQATMLYKMVRDTADHLVEKYRGYKKQMNTYARALSDMQYLQSVVAETRPAQDAAKQIDMEYTLRKAQRDLDGVGDDVRMYRQGLSDLAGSEAVAKLDKQFDDEQIALQKLTGESSPGEAPKMVPTQTATKPGAQIQ